MTSRPAFTVPDPDDTDAWFVAQLKPHGLATAKTHLARQNFPCFAPMMPANAQRKGQRTQTEKAVFPGYLFVQFDVDDRSWSKINATRGISRLVLNDPRRPHPVPAAFMAALFARCDRGGLLLPPDDLKVGDRVRVLSGPFGDMVSDIQDLPDAARISILIDLMGRKVRTQVPRTNVERLGG